MVVRMREEFSTHPHAHRRLAAILAADIAGYSRMMGHDEEGTVRRLKQVRREIVDPTLEEHYGRLIKTTGDGFLAMFDSPLEAVRCAIVVQQSVAARNTGLPRDYWLQYRIGVNLGDVIVEPDDVFGDGVNIAARLEALAMPGGVYISGGVYEQIKNKLVCGYQSLGDEKLKNITDPVRIYSVLPDPASFASATKNRRLFAVPAGIVAAFALVAAGLYAAGYWPVGGQPSLVSVGQVHQWVPVPLTSVTNRPAPTPRVEPPASRNADAAKPLAPTADPVPAAPAPDPQVAILTPSLPAARTIQTASGFRDCETCPEMLRIPGGSFRMGSDEDPSEQPIRTVAIAPFAIGRSPISVAEWNRCAAAKGCNIPLDGSDAAPARNLSWLDAKQYVDWLAQSTGKPYRLPSEAEWEYAARAGSSTRFWWGRDLEPGKANCKDCGGPQDPKAPMPVGSFARNAFGGADFGGGVAQWVADCWLPNYRDAPSDGSPRMAENCRENVLRGGSWRSNIASVRPASRTHYDTGVRYPAHGFRIARSL
ncbi:formylglycine-generating enzyme required for sulfatase activity/class 3 adenylate cyclase [Bosea sp. BE125]|uniref:SUMF1/EgtB/PvdO family nonheme iron enzyme n=1 Tax=Bosea sp. BE125 TaxID=2817909 RepID=UPI002857970C|nr:SUMF1/EgtB/PvdO family nonheme iron enzyme [Bosea sp. BE125]MDR6872013.1 formylglycine-generating enzyme required for sulfatase activity/class 3 adenylate cyclase [Bosea sp. BE125]